MKGIAGKLLIAIFVFGALVRIADMWRPIDRASWRECDMASVARNFAEESANIFMPRIDWRGTSPGYAEMEFPVYPWLVGMTYKVFGFHEEYARVWAFAFSLATLYFFFRLARSFLGDGAASVAACAFFAFNPTIVEFSTSFQPEGLTILFYVASAYYFLKWHDGDESAYAPAIVATALALLAKATAAHIGIFFGVLLLQKYGLKAFRDRRLWFFAAGSVIPALLWYAHAKMLWRNYGNSLGVSNEHHWIGLDFFTNPYFVEGILRNEMNVAWVVAGAIVALLGVFVGVGETNVRRALLWIASAFVLYIVAARTTADEWAFYYHVFSVPAAALLFGVGVGALVDKVIVYYNFGADFPFGERLAKLTVIVVFAIAMLAAFGLEAKRVRALIYDDRAPDSNLAAARELAPALKQDGLILVSGSRCFDPDGYRVAYNASFMFYWLKRKGFNICVEDQTMSKVRSFASKGARYYVAQKDAVAERPGFDVDLRENYKVVAENKDFMVLELAP